MFNARLKVFLPSIIIFSFLFAPSLRSETPFQTYVNKFELKPGETFMGQFPVQISEIPVLTWGASTYFFNETPTHNWRVLVPVPLTAPDGDITVLVDASGMRKSKMLSGTWELKIRGQKKEEKEIIFPEDKAKLLNSPDEDEETKIIRAAVKGTATDKKQYWDGLFIQPVPGNIISEFGLPRNKKGQNKKHDLHLGVDFYGEKGQPVKTPNNGIVILTKNFPFHGNTVIVNHGQGVSTIYIHLDTINVKEGQEVKTEDVLGTVGQTGLATGPHLHWGLYVLGVPVDPVQWLREDFY